jgi:DNA sulfur modification protein DndB
MAILDDENFSELIADRETQRQILRHRSKPFIERKVRKAEFAEPEEGWYVLDDQLKRDVKLAKDKPHDEVFEDEVWALLSKLGFRYLSSDRHIKIKYDSRDGASQQIDVLAVDDECALIIECKCAEGPAPKVANFKTEIESLGGKKPGLHREIRERFDKPQLKIAYLLATKNYIVRSADKERLESFSIQHFSEVDLEYYQELVGHLGTAARYQFEADIFNQQTIPELDGRVYAVEGSMGGEPYYTFLIEPEKLLKLGYVLHRSKSIRVLPSYQRLIKKNRLSQIRKFINNGGYFPNSLVVSVENEGKPIRFDPSSQAIPGSLSKSGVLYLPNKYRSLYIIDGQHRLYGYSESEYAENNTIPVVAFVDLDRNDQLRLFMEINENQKAVSKNLKHTLDADLKWDSKNLKDRAEGIKKQLCQELGEDNSSPLFNRVLVGEDQKTEIKVITLDAILRGLNQTPFIGRFTKDEIKEQGVFYVGDSAKTLKLIKDVLIGYFSYIQESLPEEWQRLPKNGGLLTINDGVTAQIQLVGDIIKHMVQKGEISPLSDSAEQIVDKLSTYVDGLQTYFKKLKEDERIELRSKYGSGAPVRLRRIFQLAVQQHRDDFQPEGLGEYWRDQSKQYNIETYARILDIETMLREDVKEILHKQHGSMWLKKGLPEKLYTHLVTEAAKKNRLIEKEEEEKTPWDCLNLIHLRDIMLHQAQWSTLFQKQYTIPGEEGLKKEQKTNWLVELNRVRNITDHEYSVSKEDADYVASLHDWLVLGLDVDFSKSEPSAENGELDMSGNIEAQVEDADS